MGQEITKNARYVIKMYEGKLMIRFLGPKKIKMGRWQVLSKNINSEPNRLFGK